MILKNINCSFILLYQFYFLFEFSIMDFIQEERKLSQLGRNLRTYTYTHKTDVLMKREGQLSLVFYNLKDIDMTFTISLKLMSEVRAFRFILQLMLH